MPNSFDDFVNQFFTHISDDNFYQSNSYTSYLSLPVSDRSNDEADIVDAKITTALIKALGYASGEVLYNRPQANRKRTDFTVKIANYPRPCFVAESKNTATTKLNEQLPQLADYMRSQGSTRGLLCDGKLILTYELDGGQANLTGEIGLWQLVEKWRGESLYSGGKTGFATFDNHDQLILKAFWQRFNRSVFEGLPKLIQDLTLTAAGNSHASDGSTWPGESRIPVFRQIEPDFDLKLTEQSAEVIVMIALDVEAQLSVRLDEYIQFELEENAYSNGNDTFDQRFEQEEAKIFSRAQAWQIPESRRNSYSSRLRQSFRFGLNAEVLDDVKRDVANDITGQNNSLAEPNRRSEKELTKAINEVYASIDEIGRLRQIFHRRRERLAVKYRQAIETHNSFKLWTDKVATILLKTSDSQKLRREFATQTAYVLFVRLLLVRILEDKGLINRIFTNGGIALWFEKIEEQYLQHAEGRSTDFLIAMAYESAQHIYAHYYSDAFVFDWYRADRNLVVQLLHRLAGFDFSEIDRDIIGHIYSGYVRSEHKHESGMYYTKIEVVEYILDQVGFKGDQIINKSLLDPSSGSGAFLVSACRRQIETFLNYHKQQGKNKQDLTVEDIRQIVNAVKDNLFGLELNPFACYLAETNLLIQVLDLIRLAREKDGDVTLDRFNIYNTDTLRYEPETRDCLRGLPFEAADLEPAEQLKSRLARFSEGFDFVVGNPPYVRADEGSEGLLEYRNEIKDTHPIESVRSLLAMKWDLFIPFIGLGTYLLRDGTGRLGMITSSAIEQVTYAARLRGRLIATTQIDEISFFPRMRLFDDAAVENTVVFLTKQPPSDDTQTKRLWHGETIGGVYKSEDVSQVEYGETVFRQTVQTEGYGDVTMLQKICYVSKGMVLHSHEVNHSGEFKKDDLVATQKDDLHPASYVEGENLTMFEVTDVRFLEYGNDLRSPTNVSRPTFPELYNRRKIMRGETSSAWLDSGNAIGNGWMFCNHSVHLFLRWCELSGIENRSITGELRNIDVDRTELDSISNGFSLEYILAVLNSPKAREILVGTTSSARRSRFQPDDFRKLPVPNAGRSEQTEIEEKVKIILSLGEEFLNLRREGWKIDTTETKVIAAPVPTKYPQIRSSSIATAKIAWGMSIFDPTAFPAKLSRRDNAFFQGRGRVLDFTSVISEQALLWLERQFKHLPSDMSFQAAEAASIEIPSTPEDAANCLRLLVNDENKIVEKVAEFNRLRDEVNEAVEKLYNDRISHN